MTDLQKAIESLPKAEQERIQALFAALEARIEKLEADYGNLLSELSDMEEAKEEAEREAEREAAEKAEAYGYLPSSVVASLEGRDEPCTL